MTSQNDKKIKVTVYFIYALIALIGSYYLYNAFEIEFYSLRKSDDCVKTAAKFYSANSPIYQDEIDNCRKTNAESDRAIQKGYLSIFILIAGGFVISRKIIKYLKTPEQ